MTDIGEFNKLGEALEQRLLLRTSPLALKLLESEADVPPEAIRPRRDRGQHLAQCQAFAMARRQRVAVAMLREDHWCWGALIAYGLVPRPEDPSLAEHLDYPALERDRYAGLVSAPLKTAAYAPGLVMIYCNNAQLRTLLLAVDYKDRNRVSYHFFPPACAYLVVPVLETGNYMVALPDPGDYERALAAEDEIILSMPAAKLAGIVEGLEKLEARGMGYAAFSMDIRPDFPQPEFYTKLFREWGLDAPE
jgi:uncharacterized protein (DUF169 family)